VRDHDAIVTAFYLSNVEQYLSQDGIWNNFCANVATMPLDASSQFIRTTQGGMGRGGLTTYVNPIQTDVRLCGGGLAAPVVVR
jgi:hypothetical protein